MIGNYLRYQYELGALFIRREIEFRVWRHAVWKRPAAVCGRRGTWIVDNDLIMGDARRNVRKVMQFFIGMLLIAGVIGWLVSVIENIGISVAVVVPAIKAALLLGLGIVAVADAAVSFHRCAGNDRNRQRSRNGRLLEQRTC